MEVKSAIKVLLSLLGLAMLFHVAILARWIPYSIGWGGRLPNDEAMYVFESVSLGVNAFLIWILLMQAGWMRRVLSPQALRAVLWIFVAVFLLNTIGNLFAATTTEKWFALVTALFCYLLLQVLRKGE